MRMKFSLAQSLIARPTRLSQRLLPVPASKRRYSYFVVDLPADVTSPGVTQALSGGCSEVIEAVFAERQRLALLAAEEQSRSWCAPAWWTVTYDDATFVVVRRISQRVFSGPERAPRCHRKE